MLHSPAWPNVGNAARLRQAEVVELGLTALPDGRFSLDFERLDALLAGARAFILNSPNNPTGWTATHDELATILALCRKHGVWLISDEVYSRLVYDGSDGGAVGAGRGRAGRPGDGGEQLLQDLGDDRLAAGLAGGAARGRATR